MRRRPPDDVDDVKLDPVHFAIVIDTLEAEAAYSEYPIAALGAGGEFDRGRAAGIRLALKMIDSARRTVG